MKLHLIWDLDGTLVNSEPEIFAQPILMSVLWVLGIWQMMQPVPNPSVCRLLVSYGVQGQRQNCRRLAAMPS